MSRIGRIFKPLVNFPRWMGLSQIIENARNIFRTVKDMRQTEKPPVREETFEQALLRLNITEEDLVSRIRISWWLSIFYGLGSLGFFIYTIYLIVHLSFGSIVGLLLTVYLAVLGYRESFWYFQMKTRRLGRTFREWLRFIVKGGKDVGEKKQIQRK